MTNAERKQRLQRVLADLDTLQSECIQDNENAGSNEASRRERHKYLETEVSVVRLLQSESRLVQQLLLGAGGFLGGALTTFIFR